MSPEEEGMEDQYEGIRRMWAAQAAMTDGLTADMRSRMDFRSDSYLPFMRDARDFLDSAGYYKGKKSRLQKLTDMVTDYKDLKDAWKDGRDEPDSGYKPPTSPSKKPGPGLGDPKPALPLPRPYNKGPDFGDPKPAKPLPYRPQKSIGAPKPAKTLPPSRKQIYIDMTRGPYAKLSSPRSGGNRQLALPPAPGDPTYNAYNTSWKRTGRSYGGAIEAKPQSNASSRGPSGPYKGPGRSYMPPKSTVNRGYNAPSLEFKRGSMRKGKPAYRK